jgi:hypothetical protein
MVWNSLRENHHTKRPNTNRIEGNIRVIPDHETRGNRANYSKNSV